MFGNIGLPEILIVLLIVLLLFGAKRIPEVAGSLGKGINEFKRNMSEAQRAITEPARDETRTVSAGDTTPAHPVSSADDDAVREPKRLLG
jgi:sec-independent protein translocase protein TatA